MFSKLREFEKFIVPLTKSSSQNVLLLSVFPVSYSFLTYDNKCTMRK